MVDSTAAYERDTNAPGYSAVNGERPISDRAGRSINHPAEGGEEAGPEHAAALLSMGVIKQQAGIYSEAEDLFLRAAEIGERTLGSTNAALLPALTSLASAQVMGGKPDAAEKLAIRIVAISVNASPEQESDVAILLNDLARLCLKQSAHGVAEPLLLRLLEMKRSKGEDHPEVGTVLASLATVRQALGRHESAEHLWRRVLEIRERTLAPNHFALAIALEHLGEACAARGKISEALQYFRRAQTIRELTLGAAHPSLRISRDRIADLQLQAEESPDAPHDAPAPAPEKPRLLTATHSTAGHSLVTSSPTPPFREKAAPPRRGTARVIEREAVADTIAQPPAVAPVLDFPAAEPRVPKPAPLPYHDLLRSIQQEMDEENGDEAAAPAEAGFFASIAAALKQRQKATVIGVGSLALLGILATASRAWTESDPQLGTGDTSPLPSARPIAAPSGIAATNHSAAPVNDAAAGAAIASAAGTPVTASRTRLADQRTTAKKPTERSAELPARVSIPKVSASLAAGFDSVVNARSGRAIADPLSVQPPPVVAASQRSAFEREVTVNQPQRAQLIGSLPVPRYPAQLIDVQGEVRVRFDVDATGRPVMSTVSVVSSPNSMLTAAVLKVIPGIRFEPARSGGADPKPISDVVQLGFQFRPTK